MIKVQANYFSKMSKLFCLIFTLLSVILSGNCTEIRCNATNIIDCFTQKPSPAGKVHLVLDPNISYYLSETYKFTNGIRSLTITSPNNTVITIPQNITVELIIQNVTEVNFQNITFHGGHPRVYHHFHSFLTINNSRSIYISQCKFRGIIGLAIYISSVHNGYFSLDLTQSVFNGTNDPSYPSQGVHVWLNQTDNTSVSVTHSKFSYFKVDASSANVSYHQRMRYRPLAIEQIRNAHSPDFIRTYVVSDCNFENNKGFVGGGLGLYTGLGVNSHYTIRRCHFRNNSVYNTRYKKQQKNEIDVTGSGGGIAALFFNCKYCRLSISDSTLIANRATLGGGIKIGFYFESSNVYINISNCTFRNNIADSGAGLYIESQLVKHLVLQAANLSNLDFHSNQATQFGAGIFVAYLPLILNGDYVRFVNNTNTSFAVISSQIEVHTNLTFKDNSGQRGGALYLSDNSQLLLDQYVSLYFENNTARDRGGAICADSISLDLLYRNYGYTFYNVHCFIKHFIKFESRTPDEYTQNITFKNNKAPKGSAIYTHTLSPCSWYSDRLPYSNISLALNWSTYHYYNTEDDQLNSSLIATAVAHYTISNDHATLQRLLKLYNTAEYPHYHVNITVQPGIPTKIFFVATDQLGSHEVSIATVEADTGGKVKPCTVHGEESIFLTSSDDKNSDDKSQVELSFCGNPGDEGKVLFKSLDGLTIEKTVSVKLAYCPEGMYLNTDHVCSCYNVESSKGIPFYTQVLNSSKHLYPWMSNNSNDTFVQMSCPSSYCNISMTSHTIGFKNQPCVNVSNSSDCLNGREGIACSSCKPRYDGLESGTLKCTRHCGTLVTVFTTLAVILLLLIIIAVLFLIRTSSYLNDHIELRHKLGPYARSFVFFCQGTFILYLNTEPRTKIDKYLPLPQIIDKTGLFLNYGLCFTFGITSSRGRVFEEYFLYLIGFIGIFFFAILIFCLLTRCIKVHRKFSILVYVLVTYSYFTYAPITFTTLRLLSCGLLTTYNSTSGDQLQELHYVWLYNSTQPCYGTSWDTFMTSVAYLTLLFYVIPLPFTYLLFAFIKYVDLRKLVNKYIRKRDAIRNSLSAQHSTSKLHSSLKLFNKLSTEYVSCFSEPHFGFWIPITMITSLTLLVIQINGAPFNTPSDKQAQYLAVVCFFYLYIRVSLKITEDIYVQFYDSTSIFFLCLSCIFLIIKNNISTHFLDSTTSKFAGVVQYFPFVSYVFLFLIILTPPAIKFCVKKSFPNSPDKEETPNEPHTASNTHFLPNQAHAEPDSDEEINDQAKPLLAHDPLNEINNTNEPNNQGSTLRPDYKDIKNQSYSYSSDHGISSPALSGDSVDIIGLVLSHENQAD
ncbi:hypothetical protein LOD99_174 [Oopsacas minuta]|uniref:Right handed beta helix domain-containing protein n=1 Tax=Oopsacas minuta TaxID=111878 RepID=A0AAV7K9G6_9METZ|nr:hypothetical protein LOD99_174 [Oopsacas minuta]